MATPWPTVARSEFDADDGAYETAAKALALRQEIIAREGPFALGTETSVSTNAGTFTTMKTWSFTIPEACGGANLKAMFRGRIDASGSAEYRLRIGATNGTSVTVTNTSTQLLGVTTVVLPASGSVTIVLEGRVLSGGGSIILANNLGEPLAWCED